MFTTISQPKSASSLIYQAVLLLRRQSRTECEAELSMSTKISLSDNISSMHIIINKQCNRSIFTGKRMSQNK